MPPLHHLRYIMGTVALAIATLTGATAAQEQADTTQGRRTLRVYLDCQRCDFDHFRREVTFVDYMRDQATAEAHVLVTSQGTGGGGSRYTFYFIGQQQFEGRQDTLYFTSNQNMTDDEVRTGLTRTFALGLVPYAARTDVAPGLNVLFEEAEEAEGPPRGTPQDDPWNLWVFRLRLGGAVEGESLQSSASMDGSVSANRTTEAMKFDINANGRYEEEHFELSDGEKVTSLTRNAQIESTIVFSLGPHWSAGFQGTVSTSTRSNYDLVLRGSPAVEYNVYPYAESTRRQITFMYTLGPVHYRYDEETLFEELEETRLQQRLDVGASFRQQWGDLNFSVDWSNYMHDFELHRLEVDGGFDIRLFQGFSLDIRGSVARIKDQLNIPLEDRTDDEILLELGELGTDYEYEFDIGFSYTFGSDFNNVVNPRMWRGGRGGGFGGFGFN
jgi:hypothetical protein